jgi:hypothetical protein
VPGARLVLLGVLIQRAIVPLADQRPQSRFSCGIDPGRWTTGVRLGAAAAFLARLLAPEIHRRETNLEALGHGGWTQATLARPQHPRA